MAVKKTPEVPPTEKVQTYYKQLSQAATNIKAASDELGKAISALDAALKKLNLGISAWVELSGNEDDWGDYWSRDIGYTKIGKQWGIALRTVSGNVTDPDHEDGETWLFNEAPRWIRIEAVGKIPDLLEALVKRTEETTEKIKKKTTQAFELAVAIGAVKESQPTEQQEMQPPPSWSQLTEQEGQK
ncbi:MAG: hypothetical protein HY649_10345 [Acidobacteria bacterium]|nr:hypothetical protein [Acidobacteriota bacterium]